MSHVFWWEFSVYFFNCAKNVNDLFSAALSLHFGEGCKARTTELWQIILRVAVVSSCPLPTSSHPRNPPTPPPPACHKLPIDQYHHLLFMYLIAPPLPVTGTTKNLPHIVEHNKKAKNRWMCLRIWIIFYSLMNQLFDQCFPSGGHSTFSFLFHNSVDKSHKISHYTKCQLIFYKTFRHYPLFYFIILNTVLYISTS